MIPTLPTTGPTLAPEDYTVKQLDADILDIVLRFPNNSNPRDDENSCKYRQEIADSTEVARCLIGQWLHERGHVYDTSWENKVAGQFMGGGMGYSMEVCQRANELQAYADGEDDNGYRTWGSLLTIR